MTFKTFKTQAEAYAAILPLYRAGKIAMWRPVGRSTVTVSVFLGCGWCKLSEEMFNALAA